MPGAGDGLRLPGGHAAAYQAIVRGGGVFNSTAIAMSWASAIQFGIALPMRAKMGAGTLGSVQIAAASDVHSSRHLSLGSFGFLTIAAVQSSLVTSAVAGHGTDAAVTGPVTSMAAMKKETIRRSTWRSCLIIKCLSSDYNSSRRL